MCGIVGFIAKEREEKTLQSMLNSQHHRGPDDKGVYIDENSGLHLGHNRLSIQDTSSDGHQPFVSDCQNYTIVFNGEVYNFKEIKKELKALGYNFRSHSDTEVILYAYKEWGIKAIEKFIGMFAFALHDLKNNKLFLVRDRAGVKPLYYYHKDSTFLFASELKSFHPYPKFKKEIHQEILPFYFQFAYIPAPHTIFKNTHKLQAGHYLEYDLNKNSFKIYKYWDIHNFYLMPKFDKDEKEIIEDLEALLKDACELRMVSDVPVGVFLSGGYDSSTVSSLLQNRGEEESISTYTIGFEDREFNEANDAKKIANYLKTKHTEQYCTQEQMLKLIDDLPFYYDEPFADDSTLPTMLVSKLAKEEVTVALSADGGDELFFGYSKYFAIEKMNQLKKSPLKYAMLKLALKLLNEKNITLLNSLLPKSKRQANIVAKFNKFKNMISAKDTQEMFIKASSKESENFLDDVLQKGKFNNFESTNFADFNKLKTLSTADQMMAIDYKTFMVDDVLCKVDRATMSVSLEGREPLLDHRIAEYLARVPSDLKYKQHKGKYLLREILKKHLPTHFTDKPKAGFTIPLKAWLQNELKEKALSALTSQELKETALFKKEKLQKITKELQRGEVKNPNFLWMVINYVAWRKKWS